MPSFAAFERKRAHSDVEQEETRMFVAPAWDRLLRLCSAVRVKGVQGVGKLGAQSLTKGRLRESNDFNYMPRRVMSCQR